MSSTVYVPHPVNNIEIDTIDIATNIKVINFFIIPSLLLLFFFNLIIFILFIINNRHIFLIQL